jgi:hypothetical protein
MLFLDDPGIQERVQIAMLIEDDCLRVSLVEKYRKVIEAKRGKFVFEDAMQDPIINENIQKLFISHLCLDELTDAEQSDVVENFLINYVLEEEEANFRNPAPDVSKANKPPNPSNIPAPQGDQKKSRTHPTDHNKPDLFEHTNRLLHPYEGRKIKEHIEIYGHNSLGEKWRPRTIRAFIFKYVLARLLLVEMGEEEPDCKKLLKAFAPKHAERDFADRYHRIVSQVDDICCPSRIKTNGSKRPGKKRILPLQSRLMRYRKGTLKKA